MPFFSPGDITRLLSDPLGNLDVLMARIAADLRIIARSRLRRHRRDPMFDSAELVNEAYLRMHKSLGTVRWQSRVHFFGFWGRLMSQALIDLVRHGSAQKRAGVRVPLTDTQVPGIRTSDPFIVRDAIDRLTAENCRAGQIAHLVIVEGYSNAEAARTLGISLATFGRDWHAAKAWLIAQWNEEAR